MSEQEDNEDTREPAQTLEKFHDRYSHRKLPDWVTEEAKEEETVNALRTYKLGNHTAEFDEQSGSLTLSGAGMRMSLSADETYNLLMLLHDTYRDTLQQLTQRHQKQEQS